MMHKRSAWLVVLVVALSLVTAASPWSLAQPPLPEQADEPVVVRLYFESREQLNAVAAEYDVWEVRHDLGYAVVMLSPAEFQDLQAQGYRMEIDPDRTREVRTPVSIPGYPCYRTVEETYASLQTLATTYPTLVDLSDIGDSWDKATAGGPAGYDLYALRITNENIGGTKPRFFLMAEIHARELTTAETATRFAEYLLSNYGTNPEITFFVDYSEIYIVPMTNPDGRKFAEGGDWWRKNTDNDDGCTFAGEYGVDLNRNHSFYWGGAGTDPCDETYQGPTPASEPETQAIQNFVQGLFPDQRGPGDTDPAPLAATGMFITLHSFSELVLWPWGWTYGSAPNAAQLQTIGTKLATYNYYTPEQSSDLYTTTGSSDDWAYGNLGIAAFTFEMGTQFFQGCTTFESTIWPDNRNALLYAMKIPKTPYMTAYGPDTLTAAVSPDSVPQRDPVQLTATVNDQNNGNQTVQAAEYYVLPLHGAASPGDPGTGVAMQAADGAWNSTVENVGATLNTASLTPGDYIVAVRGRDTGNNWGPFTAVFLTITPAINPDAIALAAAPLDIPIVYGESTVTATVTSEGAPVDRVEVSFGTDLGSVSPATALTDKNGQAFSTLSAGATAGTAHVTGQVSATLAANVDVSIHVPDAPVAALSDNSPVCDGTPVAFTNLSSGPPSIPISYLWAFGDGGTSSQVSPQHLYPETGFYTVVLTATNVGGSDVATGTVTVAAAPEAAFTFAPLQPLVGETVSFLDASTDDPFGWDWDFGDGASSSEQNPQHSYDLAGTYTVSLQVQVECGWSAAVEQSLTVHNQPDEPIDGLAAANDSPTLLTGLTILTATVTAGTNVSYVWDLGDESLPASGPIVSHTYPAIGTYTATVTATNGSNSLSVQTIVTILDPFHYVYLPVIIR